MMLDNKLNILSIDLEDWFCHDNYSQNMRWQNFEVRIHIGLDKILEELDNCGISATFYCLGWIAENQPKLIKEIHRRGHHIGCHSFQHQLSSRLSYSEFLSDTRKAKDLLENLIGENVTSFRAPSFSFTKSNTYCLQALIELGFETDSSIFSAKRESGGMPELDISAPTILSINGHQIKEFPMSYYRFFGKKIIYSGGGYFRIIPYSICKSIMNKNNYNMTYFHPSDFDPGQPSMSHLPIKRRIKNEINLKGTFVKFQHLLSDFNFVSVKQATSIINWDSVDRVVLNSD
jgi:polysaccharide deacetylase family protein (PEP-CTERM system associated)